MPMRAEDDFDAFVRARWTATARLAYALTLDHQKAEDLAQEAFTKLWFHWTKLAAGSPDGYLRKIVTTIALAGGPLLGSVRSSGEPGVAGGLAVPTATPSNIPSPLGATPSLTQSPGRPGDTPSLTQSSNVFLPAAPTGADSTTKLPPPWSEEKFTRLPDANAYRPHAYYLARLTIPTENLALLVYSREACVVADEHAPASFGVPHVCFRDWKPGQRSSYWSVTATTREKSSEKLDYTLVFGAVSTDARKVRVTAAGKTYLSDAIGTPATDRLRFFVTLVPMKDAKVKVTPLNAQGKLAAPPAQQPCTEGCPSGTPSQ
jgi:hypothetical protein